jgi:hypothetical protein
MQTARTVTPGVFMAVAARTVARKLLAFSPARPCRYHARSAPLQSWPSVQRTGVAVRRTEIPALGFALLGPLPRRIKPRAFRRHRRRPFRRPLLPDLPLDTLRLRPPRKFPRRILEDAGAGLFLSERWDRGDKLRRSEKAECRRQNPNSVHHETLSIGVRNNPTKPSGW